MPTKTLTKPNPTLPDTESRPVAARRRRARRVPSRVQEAAADYPAVVVTPRCFVCGMGADVGALEGSGHANDWVHAACLSQPIDW